MGNAGRTSIPLETMTPRAQITSLPVVMALTCVLAMSASAEVKIPALETGKLDAKLAGRVWIEELNCTACHHTAENEVECHGSEAGR